MLTYLILNIFEGKTSLEYMPKSQNSAGIFLQAPSLCPLAGTPTTCHWAVIEKKICLKHDGCVCGWVCVCVSTEQSMLCFAHHLIHTFSQNPAVHLSILILNTASKTGAAIFNLSHSCEMADGTRHVCILAPGKDRNSLCNAISAYFTLTQASDSGGKK